MNEQKIASLDEFLTEASGENVEYATVQISDTKSVRIGSITADDFVAWQEERESGKPDARKNAAALIILRSLVDENGKRIGSEDKVPQLRTMKLRVSEKVLKAIFKLNCIKQKDGDEAKNA